MEPLEPDLALAFSMRATPGAYVMLLGAGASLSAGVSSAWEVQHDLISRLAVIESRGAPEDLEQWFEQNHGERPTYDGVLALLTRTPIDRQGLLRGYFESGAEGGGPLQPAPAHKAIASLVVSGYVRIVVTTNFDHLMERALQAEGVEPLVATSPASIAGLDPLYLLRPGQCLIIHLHGDYLSSTMLNTADELNQYPDAINRFLDQLFADHGLVIAGWSAQWDVALRSALERATSRRFGLYWVDPYPLNEVADHLAHLKAATVVQATADEFLSRLADDCQALADSQRVHPLTVTTAVATAKRELSGGSVAISLHDRIRREAQRIATSPVVHPGTRQTGDINTDFDRRSVQIEAECEVLAALIATATYWGDDRTDGWWNDLPSRFAVRPIVAGVSLLISLDVVPSLIVTYAAGIAACATRRDDVVADLLVRPRGQDLQGIEGTLLNVVTTGIYSRTGDGGKRLFDYLEPLIANELGRGDAYADDWERWETLVWTSWCDARLQHQPTSTMTPYLRLTGWPFGYHLLLADQLREEITDERHPLLRGGMCGGDPQRFAEALNEADKFASARVNQIINQTQTTPFYIQRL